jgi:hypothetical protein
MQLRAANHPALPEPGRTGHPQLLDGPPAEVEKQEELNHENGKAASPEQFSAPGAWAVLSQPNSATPGPEPVSLQIVVVRM